MFTPQKKGWFLSPRAAADGKDDGNSKGKGVAGGDPLSTPLAENGSGAAGGSGDAEVWRSFRETGFLDKSSVQRRDREALTTRISELEKELHEYQFNMGLLLIEKKEWFSSDEEMRQGLAESEEMLKRERSAHLIAVSEFEKREETMRNALGVEKQCVADLEKALRDMRGEIAEVKFTSDKKLVDAHALEASIEVKYLEVEGKLHSADARLAEASRRNSEIDRKLEDMEVRERKVQREFLSLNAERKAHEKDLVDQRDHLQNWEKKLQEGQKRLGDGQRLLNEREERSNEIEVILKKKEEEFEESRRMIEVNRNSLKEKEDDIITRLRALAVKEKEAEIKEVNLAKKEKNLLAIEEKLNVRESVEIQKLVDDHNAILDARKQELEMEMEQKRKSFDAELKRKLESVEEEKIKIGRQEDLMSKREQAIESKMGKLKIKEKDLDVKSKALKKWELSVKDDEKKLQVEKEQLAKDMQELVVLKAGLESLKSAIEAEKHRVKMENENLKLTMEDRDRHVLLQSKLKQEIEEYGRLKESLLREADALRQEREKFEKEWEELDGKRMGLEAEQKQLSDEKNRIEKWRHTEEERLKREEQEARANIQRELESLVLKKEAFESAMEYERSEAHELVKREHADIAREFELGKHELEINMQKKQEDVEKKLQQREAELDRRRETELNHIKTSSDLNESKIRKLRVEQDRLEREKEELTAYRSKLETDQLEIQKDIDTLRTLSRNLKDQRGEFTKERELFLAMAEQCKICKNCGVPLSELELLALRPSKEIEDGGNVLLPRLAGGYFEERVACQDTEISTPNAGSHGFNSGARVSWLQKCSKLFKSPVGKKAENSAEGQAEKSISFGAQLDRSASEGEANYEPMSFNGIGNDSFGRERAQHDDSRSNEKEESERLDKSCDEPEPSLGITDNSVDIRRIYPDDNSRGRDDDPIINPSINEVNEIDGPENDSQPKPSIQIRRQPGRRGRPPKTIRRTRSVVAVVEDAKAILGEAASSEMKKNGHENGDAKESLSMQEGSQGEDSLYETRTRQKRRLPYPETAATSQLGAEDSETRSESVSMGGRRKRRQTSVQAPGEKPYNLRRSSRTAGAVAAAAQVAPDQVNVETAAGHQPSPQSEIFENPKYDGEATSCKHQVEVGEKMTETTQVLEKTDVGSIMELNEGSSPKLVRFGTEAVVECDEEIIVQSVQLSDQNREVDDEVDGKAAAAAAASAGDVESIDATPSGSGDEGGSEDDEEEDSEKKRNSSIGKKLWTFFTS